MLTQEIQIIDQHATEAIVDLASSEKHQEYKEKIAAKVEKRIGTKISKIVKNMLSLANGGYWAEVLDDGSVRKHFERPNLAANIYLLDRFMGKPIVKQEVKVEKKGIFIIETMIKRLASPAIDSSEIELKNNNEDAGYTQPGELNDKTVSSDVI